jgi:hypothetical protein
MFNPGQILSISTSRAAFVGKSHHIITGRFRDAFITEANEFTACCLDDAELPMTLEGAINAVRIGAALQESFITGKKIEFDENGLRIWDRGITRARI